MPCFQHFIPQTAQTFLTNAVYCLVLWSVVCLFLFVFVFIMQTFVWSVSDHTDSCSRVAYCIFLSNQLRRINTFPYSAGICLSGDSLPLPSHVCMVSSLYVNILVQLSMLSVEDLLLRNKTVLSQVTELSTFKGFIWSSLFERNSIKLFSFSQN